MLGLWYHTDGPRVLSTGRGWPRETEGRLPGSSHSPERGRLQTLGGGRRQQSGGEPGSDSWAWAQEPWGTFTLNSVPGAHSCLLLSLVILTLLVTESVDHQRKLNLARARRFVKKQMVF